MGVYVYEVTFFDLKPQRRLYEFLVHIKVMDFSFDCLYLKFNNESNRIFLYKISQPKIFSEVKL